MRVLQLIVGVIVIAAVFVLLHYSLPGRDVVRIVGTDVKRMDLGTRPFFWARPDPLAEAQGTRDVRFINVVLRNGKPFVYRNEDTGWGYPPYLKFDSGTLGAEAQGLVSTEKEPVWVVMTHYGWRFELLSLYPNAVAIRRAAGPDEILIPWFNIVLLAALGGLLVTVWTVLKRLRERHLEPVIDDIEGGLGDVAAAAGDLRSRWRRWLDTWKPKPKRRL
jgi:hypothetical protein